jgi:GTP1/Obg family GTP-binding protein
MFLWYNIQKEQSDNIMNSIQCSECGEWVKKEEFDLHLMKTRPDIMIERLKSLEEKFIRMEKDRDFYAKDLEDMANERDAYKDAIFSIPKSYDIIKHIMLTLENKVKKK